MLLNLVNAELFLNKTVKEIVNGYEDSLLYTANILDAEKVPSSKFSILAGVSIFSRIKRNFKFFEILIIEFLKREMELLTRFFKFFKICKILICLCNFCFIAEFYYQHRKKQYK